MRRSTVLGTGLALALGQAAWAVGGDTDTPPTPTQTTTECADGMVWDETRSTCVAIEDSRLEGRPDRLLATARELAYADRHVDALRLLALAPDQDDSMVQTYLGYAHRSLGDMDRGMAHYARAVEADPDNLLVRAYRGMAYLIQGNSAAARAELAEIRTRGGTGGWPEQALAAAIAQGTTSGYDY